MMAGGTEHMSMIPMGGIVRPNNEMALHPFWATVYTSMGQTAEHVASRYNISREDQDVFSAASHAKALAAREKFKEEIVLYDQHHDIGRRWKTGYQSRYV
jgi:acetyl-CoA acyltransferase